MLSSIKTYNGLNGEILTREEVENLINKAKAEGQKHILQKLEQLLNTFPEAKRFDIETTPQDEILEENLLPGIDYLAIPEEGETPGLGKPVSPDDIYQMITDLIINTIKKVGHLPWQREWEKTNLYQGKQAVNFESKNPYRGINYFLLNFKVEEIDGEKILTRRNFDVPYFLTFNQIKKNKGDLKKGSTGFKVVYFTKLHKVDEKGKNGKELSFGTYNKKKFDAWVDKNINNLNRDADYYKNSYLPILKYYNVFSADDITGIDWGELPKNPNVSKTLKERIEIAELIVKNYPNPPRVMFEGDQPAYIPKVDQIMMTPIEAFKNEQSYYSTFFHELIHSTGHSKRLKRGNDTRTRDGSFEDKQAYAFEELVAEMGAVFLSSEAGILFKTLDNSAKYLKGWNSRLVAAMLEDNRYFFRASSKSQAAADYILDRDKEGNPAYLKKLNQLFKKKEELEKNRAVDEKLNQLEQLLQKTTNPKKEKELVSKIDLLEQKIKQLEKPKKKTPPKPKAKVNKKTGQYALLGPQQNKTKTKGLAGEESVTQQPQSQEVCEVQESLKSVTQPTQNPNSLAARLQQSENQDFEYYKIDNSEIAKFLGRVEVKQKESIGISVTAPQGAGKTRFCFQLVDAFADNYKVGIASMEEHPASSLFLSKVPEYIANKNIPNVEAPEINTMQDLHKLIMANDVIMIDSFEKLRELHKTVQVDKDLRKKYNGKLFIIIFQLTSDGKMRGGSKSQFDVDIVLLTEKFDDYKQNYIYTDKNRYNHIPASHLKYNIYQRKMLPIEGETNNAYAEENTGRLIVTSLN